MKFLKHAFLNALLVGSVLNSQSWAQTNTAAIASETRKEVVAEVTQRNSHRSIIYSLESNGDDVSMVFSLKTSPKIIRELKRLDLDVHDEEVKLRGDYETYSFNILKTMTKASRDTYKWCWTPLAENGHELTAPATIGAAAFVGVFATMALCAVVPAAPFIAGVLLTPVDGTITFMNSIFGKHASAERKFKKMLQGESTIVSRSVFNALSSRIQAL